MHEYIEREAALAAMSKHGITKNMKANKAVAELPAADVDQVVRCRECKYSKPPAILTQRYGAEGTLTCTAGPCNRRNVGADFFCGYGKKREKN